MFIYFWERGRDRAWAGERQRERETQNPKQAPGSELSAQSPMQGSNSQTARSWPEPKLDAQPTEPPRCPLSGFNEHHCLLSLIKGKRRVWGRDTEPSVSSDLSLGGTRCGTWNTSYLCLVEPQTWVPEADDPVRVAGQGDYGLLHDQMTLTLSCPFLGKGAGWKAWWPELIWFRCCDDLGQFLLELLEISCHFVTCLQYLLFFSVPIYFPSNCA